jgi:hypothetical protein
MMTSRTAAARASDGMGRRARFARLPKLQEHEVGRPHSTMRLRNIVAGQLDVRVDPIYDFFGVTASTNCVATNLFLIPWGQQYTITGAGSPITKTFYHTNLVSNGGSMPAPQKMLVKNISVVPRPDMHPADVNALAGQYVFTFSTLGKEYWQGHGLKLPGGGGAFISGLAYAGTGSAAAESVFSTSNGWPTAQNVAPITDDVPDVPGYAPPPPITGVLLETSQPFNVNADPTLTAATVYAAAATANGFTATGFNVWVYLEGLKLVAVV